jgi:hypothetical protein
MDDDGLSCLSREHDRRKSLMLLPTNELRSRRPALS